MANMIEYAQVFQGELDTQLVNQATSGWMEANSEYVKYNGGNEIKIASILMDGLADYSREDGFPRGNVTLKFETHGFTQDRARTFQIDAMDFDESNFVLIAAKVMSEYQKDYVVPEVEAYRYSKIAKLAAENSRCSNGYAPKADTIWDALCTDLTEIQDKIGESFPLVITMSIKTARILNENDRFRRIMSVTDFQKGAIHTQVQAIDGTPIIKVPSELFYTDYIFKTGGAGQESGGFERTAEALPINWIITAKQAPIAVSKTEKIRIFEPNQNIKADAYKLDLRKYHDLWITQNKWPGVFVNIGV